MRLAGAGALPLPLPLPGLPPSHSHPRVAGSSSASPTGTQQHLLSDSSPSAASPFQQVHTPRDWSAVSLCGLVSPPATRPTAASSTSGSGTTSGMYNPPSQARYPQATSASSASFRLPQQPRNEFDDSSDNNKRRSERRERDQQLTSAGAASAADRQRSDRQTTPSSSQQQQQRQPRGDVPRNLSHASIATTDSSTTPHSLSFSALHITSPQQQQQRQQRSDPANLPRPIHTSPASDSRQSGYDGSPESASGSGRTDDPSASPPWAAHFTRAGAANTPVHQRPPATTVRSESVGSFHTGVASSRVGQSTAPFPAESSPSPDRSRAGSTSSGRSSSAAAAPPTPSLMSPQRSVSPERIGILSPAKRRIIEQQPPHLMQRKTSDRSTEDLPVLARQSSRTHSLLSPTPRSTSGNSLVSPPRSVPSPHRGSSSGGGGVAGLKLSVGSSAESIHGVEPRRSPPGSAAGGVPNFARGNFLGSPAAGLMSFSDDDDDQEDEEEGGIEIMETIPYQSGASASGHTSSTSGTRGSFSDVKASPSASTGHPFDLRSSREAEESESAAAFKPKLKLRLASMTADEDDDESEGLSSAESRGFTGGSPKNQNVFGLKLTNLTDSTAGPPSVAQSQAGTMTNTRNSTTTSVNLPATSPSLQASLSDSLTSSGRIALANFHASHAKAMMSKRVPQQASRGGGGGQHGGGGGGGGSTGGKKGKHRVSESYDVSQHGTLLLDGFEIGSMGIQRTPQVADWDQTGTPGDEEDWENTRRSMGSAGLHEALEMERERLHGPAAGLAALRTSGGSGSSFGSPPFASPSSSATSLSVPPGGGLQSPLSGRELYTPSANSNGGRRASAVAQKLLLTPGGGGGGFTHGGGPVTPGGGLASLGIEFRLSDMVRIGELGSGQNGVVHKALYLPTLRIVALKVCTVFDKDERHQMMKELKSFNACNSPYILSFVGACFMEGRITMALEHMNRGSLDQVVKKQGPLHVSTIRNISKHVLRGLKYMHSRKCIHRDIKPANVLLDNDGRAVLSDFGLVKQLDATNQMASTFVGTMLYLSPERMTGDSFSYSSDIWSWGISVIYLATGALDLPKDYWALLQYVQKPSPGLDREKFPATLCDFVDACLVKDPLARPSASELLLHPFIREVDPPGTPLHHIWPFSAGKVPDAKEMDLLVQAVIDHYYFTPAQVAAGLHLQSPQHQAGGVGGFLQPKTVFTLSRIDLTRIHSLAQQLAWNPRALTDEFIRRLTVKGEMLDGVPGEANGLAEELFSPAPNVNVLRHSTSFSAGSSSSGGMSSVASSIDAANATSSSSSLGSSRAPSQSHSPILTAASLQRAKLSRQKSVTLDHDPQFTGEFPFTGGAGITSGAGGSSVGGGSSLRTSFDRSHTGSSQPRANAPSSHSTSSTAAAAAAAAATKAAVLHTTSPGRRSDDSSDNNESDVDLTPGKKRSSSASSAASRSLSNTRGGAIAFDPNAKIRSFRTADFQAELKREQQHQQASSTSKAADSHQHPTHTSAKASPLRASKQNNLGLQLESLHEGESD